MSSPSAQPLFSSLTHLTIYLWKPAIPKSFIVLPCRFVLPHSMLPNRSSIPLTRVHRRDGRSCLSLFANCVNLAASFLKRPLLPSEASIHSTPSSIDRFDSYVRVLLGPAGATNRNVNVKKKFSVSNRRKRVQITGVHSHHTHTHANTSSSTHIFFISFYFICVHTNLGPKHRLSFLIRIFS